MSATVIWGHRAYRVVERGTFLAFSQGVTRHAYVDPERRERLPATAMRVVSARSQVRSTASIDRQENESDRSFGEMAYETGRRTRSLGSQHLGPL